MGKGTVSGCLLPLHGRPTHTMVAVRQPDFRAFTCTMTVGPVPGDSITRLLVIRRALTCGLPIDCQEGDD